MIKSLIKFTSTIASQGMHKKLLTHPLQPLMLKRWAGHSKWQNIKAQKTAKDIEKGKVFSKLCKAIELAVRKGGPNPELNVLLKSEIAKARKFNVPNATINNAIKSSSEKEGVLSMLVVQGPGRSTLLVEISTNKPEAFKYKMAGFLKRHNSRYDNSARDEFEPRGVIICKANKDDKLHFEKALEHAIMVEADEVESIEDKTQLRFTCSAQDEPRVRTQLIKLDYNVESSSIEYIPKRLVVLNDDDLLLCEKIYKRLEEESEVVRIIDNIS